MSEEQIKDEENGLEVWLSENAATVFQWVFSVALVTMLAAAGAYFALFLGPPLSIDPATLGQAGDYFGGLLNPVLSFLSVSALLVSLVVQARELRLSRIALKVSQEELRLSREEQAKAAGALSAQNAAIQRQSFEQTFFSMLRRLDDVLVSTTHADIYGHTVRGREAFVQKVHEAFKSISDRNFYDASPPPATSYLDEVGSRLGHMLNSDREGHLTRYARVLTTILEHLTHSEIASTDVYPKTLRSLLSRNELLFVYFLCLDERWNKLKLMVESFHLLAYLDHKATGLPNDSVTFFRRTAFQE